MSPLGFPSSVCEVPIHAFLVGHPLSLLWATQVPSYSGWLWKFASFCSFCESFCSFVSMFLRACVGMILKTVLKKKFLRTVLKKNSMIFSRIKSVGTWNVFNLFFFVFKYFLKITFIWSVLFIYFLLETKIYIDNNKVEEKDEKFFPQSTKPDQSKTIFLHCTRRSIDKSMYKICQKPKSNSLKCYPPLSNYKMKAN